MDDINLADSQERAQLYLLRTSWPSLFLQIPSWDNINES